MTSHLARHPGVAPGSNITDPKPLKVGNTVCCYTDTVRIGKTSLSVSVAVDATGEPRRL